jgi:hypothetical protein
LQVLLGAGYGVEEECFEREAGKQAKLGGEGSAEEQPRLILKQWLQSRVEALETRVEFVGVEREC